MTMQLNYIKVQFLIYKQKKKTIDYNNDHAYLFRT